VQSRPLRLLSPENLVSTSSIDHAEWNFGGIVGYVSRQRFKLVASLLPRRRLHRILEVGYGSGIFVPELAARADHVYGVDVHGRADDVTAALARDGVAGVFVRAGAEALPYENGTFDAVVAVSALEFVADLGATLREMSRVLQPGGRAVVVTPGDHPLLDAALRLATGASARRDFGNRRTAVMAAIESEMRVVASARFPRYGPLPLYRAFALEPRGETG
jgi:ubiquinone/menaquinone biosynthesis C-methylase UbiE